MPQEFESPQEAKEYMENMGKEYRVGCFSKQKADGKTIKPHVNCAIAWKYFRVRLDCHKLGAFLEAINSDYTKAGKIFQSNCDDYGYAKSCLKFGTYALLGRNLSAARPNPKQAYEYFEKGCRLKDAESCLYAGLVLISSQLKEQQDLKKVSISHNISILIFVWREKFDCCAIFVSGLWLPNQKLWFK